MLPYLHEAVARVNAPVRPVFEYIDEPARLSSHMNKSSWRMGGGAMQIWTDEARGQKVGSRIRLSGRMVGLALNVEEAVIERTVPIRKVWQTLGTPRLLVIDHYRMGFELSPRGEQSQLRVFIEYALPQHAFSRLVAWLFARYYASWCTRSMVQDTVRHFAEGSRQAATFGSAQ